MIKHYKQTPGRPAIFVKVSSIDYLRHDSVITSEGTYFTNMIIGGLEICCELTKEELDDLISAMQLCDEEKPTHVIAEVRY